MKSPYWNWVERHNNGIEPIGNNPSDLVDTKQPLFSEFEQDFIDRFNELDLSKVLTGFENHMFSLVVIQGLSVDEVSKKLNMNRTKIYRIMDKIKNKLIGEMNKND